MVPLEEIRRQKFNDSHKEVLFVPVTEAHLKYLCEGESTANYRKNDPASPSHKWRVRGQYSPVQSGIVMDSVLTDKIDLVAYLLFRDVDENPDGGPLQPGELMLALVFEVKDAHHKTDSGIKKAINQLLARITKLNLTALAPRRPDGTAIEMLLISQIGFDCRYFKVAFEEDGGYQIRDFYHPDSPVEDRTPGLWDRDINAPDSQLPDMVALINREILQAPGPMRHPRYQAHA